MSVNTGYTFVATTNATTNENSITIKYAPTITAYTKGWFFHGSIGIYMETESNITTYYMKCADIIVSFTLSEIADIDGNLPSIDPVVTFDKLTALII